MVKSSIHKFKDVQEENFVNQNNYVTIQNPQNGVRRSLCVKIPFKCSSQQLMYVQHIT
jgi:hypothetical protein